MKNKYESPFQSRYGSKWVRDVFSPFNKYMIWRELWIILAKGEQSLGLDIYDEQIKEMEHYVSTIPWDRVAKIERETQHDVMAHIKAFAEQCPKASPIIHLGATSAYVADNADVLMMSQALSFIIIKIGRLLRALRQKAEEHKYTPTLAYTHFQPAQPTTFGKRICMWHQDLNDDYHRLMRERRDLKILGCKGATGTCASFLELFDGDYDKVKALDAYVAEQVNIPSVLVSGQTYSRKQDYYVFSVLSGIAQTLSKIANDIRLMSGRGEFYEPFGDSQVGSSAMAYKQNPIKCEKVVSLTRLVINNATAIANTSANQWLERSLDDSAIRRILIPETFLALDEALITMTDVIKNGVVQEAMSDNIVTEASKIVTEGILMLAVKRGGNRQELHEAIRQYALLAPNDFIKSIYEDERFNLTEEEVLELADINKLIGIAPHQVGDYLKEIEYYEED